MPARADTKPEAGSGQKTGCYVYGIVPGDVKLNSGVRGVKDREIKLVRSGDVAALVSKADLSQPLGTPEDLQAHEEILDSTVTTSPVLPIRFGAVLTNEEAVVDELLEPHHDQFAAALEELDGCAEYVVKGRYVERVILEEIMSENPDAEQLWEQIREADADATRDTRIQLGEFINNAVMAKREQDTRVLLSAMEDHCKASFVREPTHELDAVYVGFLLDMSKADELERVVEDLEDDWEGRVELSARGPLAPWDFVNGGQEPQG